MTEPTPGAARTVPQSFVETVRRRPDAVALRWREPAAGAWTWTQYAERVAAVAGRLRALGFEPGERAVLFMRNVPAFHVADTAVLMAGGTPISLYASSSPEQARYVLAHSRATVAVVDRGPFLDRVLAVRDQLPDLRLVLAAEPGGLVAGPGEEPEGGLPPGVLPLADDADRQPALDLAAAAEQVAPDDLATVIYTSGTTGPPKGVMIDHVNVAAQSDGVVPLFGDVSGWRFVSYLPMAHVAERVLSHYLHVGLGTEVTCCPDQLRLAEYLVAVRPQLLFGPPRVFEKLRAGIEAALAALPAEQREAMARAFELGRVRDEALSRGEDLPEVLQAQWEAVDARAFAPLRARIGLDQVKVMFSGAAPIPAEVVAYFRHMGLPMAEIYGMSENTGGMAFEARRVRPGWCGPAVPGAEIRLAEDGEVLCRGPIVFRGYLDDPTRTAETLVDGWLRTGDIGELDPDGYLRIVDRKKELIITAGGKNISPANIEAALKSVPLVGQAMVVGEARPYLVALLTLDPDVAGARAGALGIADAGLEQLAADQRVLDEVRAGVAAANARFSHAEHVRRFVLLGHEWQPDSAQLTPTMKLKRRGVLAAYGDLVEQMYAGGGTEVEAGQARASEAIGAAAGAG